MKQHLPKPGRRVFLCDHKDHQGIPERRFVRSGEDEPRCSKHGKMRHQENAPYLGMEIPNG